MKEFDLEELAEFDGKDGKPVYIAHKGKVFDVTGSKLWKAGVHMKRHHAGADLSTDIKAAPHMPEVLDRYPQVGVLKQPATAEVQIPELLSRLLKKYPMLRRHPHPSTVHFPIVFMLATTVFNVLYVVTGIKAFEVTAVNCLGAGILFTPLVILTGLFTWWLNYMARPLHAIHVKMWCSLALLLTGIAAFAWHVSNPHILDSFQVQSFFYFLLILALSPLVVVIGWFGAKLTFPFEED